MFISIIKSIFKIKNIYKMNGSVIINGVTSFNKKDKKFTTCLFFVFLKINKNNK